MVVFSTSKRLILSVFLSFRAKSKAGEARKMLENQTKIEKDFEWVARDKVGARSNLLGAVIVGKLAGVGQVASYNSIVRRWLTRSGLYKCLIGHHGWYS